MKHALLERLMHYYHFVAAKQELEPECTVKSHQIAELVHMDDSLVRKDLAAIGVRGNQRMGYRAAEVLAAIRELLGFDEPYGAVVIGAGRLGSALASYPGFRHYGVEIRGLFDIAPQKAGLTVGSHVIQPMAGLRKAVKERQVSVAILTVPPEAAQEVADLAVAAGVPAIWNFATTSLTLPDHIIVRHEHITVGLAELGYQLKQTRGDVPPPS